MDTPTVPLRSKFESEMQVRPDDIDMNRHVHNSRYFDYVLAARYDQMARCYGMPMEEFIRHGFGWVVKVIATTRWSTWKQDAAKRSRTGSARSTRFDSSFSQVTRGPISSFLSS